MPERVREFEPGEIAAAAEYIREISVTHPRVYLEEQTVSDGWVLVYGDDATRAAEFLEHLSGRERRFRVRGMRLSL